MKKIIVFLFVIITFVCLGVFLSQKASAQGPQGAAVVCSGGVCVSEVSDGISESKASAKCIVSGCGGELCVSKASDDGISVCSLRHDIINDCYRDYGECGEQLDGKCGWKQTAKLLDCLKNPPFIKGY